MIFFTVHVGIPIAPEFSLLGSTGVISDDKLKWPPEDRHTLRFDVQQM